MARALGFEMGSPDYGRFSTSSHSSPHQSSAKMLQRTVLRAAPRRIPQLLTGATARHSSTQPAPATIVDRGFWRSLIPKPLRKENRSKVKSKHWNPATFFIVIFLLIGSMSIQMIALRNSFGRYMRQSEVKIATLREVVERIQKGEKFDVEKALGTGEKDKEDDWAEGKFCRIAGYHGSEARKDSTDRRSATSDRTRRRRAKGITEIKKADCWARDRGDEEGGASTTSEGYTPAQGEAIKQPWQFLLIYKKYKYISSLLYESISLKPS